MALPPSSQAAAAAQSRQPSSSFPAGPHTTHQSSSSSSLPFLPLSIASHQHGRLQHPPPSVRSIPLATTTAANDLLMRLLEQQNEFRITLLTFQQAFQAQTSQMQERIDDLFARTSFLMRDCTAESQSHGILLSPTTTNSSSGNSNVVGAPNNPDFLSAGSSALSSALRAAQQQQQQQAAAAASALLPADEFSFLPSPYQKEMYNKIKSPKHDGKYSCADALLESVQNDENVRFQPFPALLMRAYEFGFGVRGLSIMHFIPVNRIPTRNPHGISMADFSRGAKLPPYTEPRSMADIVWALHSLYLFANDFYSEATSSITNAAYDFCMEETHSMPTDATFLMGFVTWLDSVFEQWQRVVAQTPISALSGLPAAAAEVIRLFSRKEPTLAAMIASANKLKEEHRHRRERSLSSEHEEGDDRDYQRQRERSMSPTDRRRREKSASAPLSTGLVHHMNSPPDESDHRKHKRKAQLEVVTEDAATKTYYRDEDSAGHGHHDHNKRPRNSPSSGDRLHSDKSGSSSSPRAERGGKNSRLASSMTLANISRDVPKKDGKQLCLRFVSAQGCKGGSEVGSTCDRAHLAHFNPENGLSTALKDYIREKFRGIRADLGAL